MEYVSPFAVGADGGVLSKLNRSAADVAEVPYPKKTGLPLVSVFVVPDWTRTSTVPAAWAGAAATTWVSERIVTEVDSAIPKSTCSWPAAPEKLRPEIVTAVPPVDGPEVILRPVTTGVRSTTSNAVAGICWTWSTFDMFHWFDGIPVKNMSEPL